MDGGPPPLARDRKWRWAESKDVCVHLMTSKKNLVRRYGRLVTLPALFLI